MRGDPDNENAHIVLARALLALQDGIGAEGEIQRAVDAGYDARAVPQWRAEGMGAPGQDRQGARRSRQGTAGAAPYATCASARARSPARATMPAPSDALDAALHLAPNDAGIWTDIGRFRST